MRYSSLAQDVFSADRYQSAENTNSSSPVARYSDPQLYALALYLYSLRPPPNPNHFDASAARGKVLFSKLKCATCHTPPLYTNNKLVAVDGFKPPVGDADVIPVRIGVDPRYTLQTHKGTRYYKVPSLKGVSGIAAPSVITVRRQRSKTGLTQIGLIPDTCPQALKGTTEKRVRFQGISSVFNCRHRNAEI